MYLQQSFCLALSVSFEFKKEETYVQDRFFDRVTLLYDGSTVVLHWTVTDANLSYAYLVLDDVVVDRKVVAGVKVRLELRVTGSTKIGKYKCRVGSETSEDGFELAYKLCKSIQCIIFYETSYSQLFL